MRSTPHDRGVQDGLDGCASNPEALYNNTVDQHHYVSGVREGQQRAKIAANPKMNRYEVTVTIEIPEAFEPTQYGTPIPQEMWLFGGVIEDEDGKVISKPGGAFVNYLPISDWLVEVGTRIVSRKVRKI